MKMNQNKIPGVKISNIIPIVLKDGTIKNLIGYLNVYDFKNLIMYEAAYHFDSTVNDELLKDEYRYQYFVYHKDSLYGTAYEVSDHPAPMRRLVDSILREWGYKNMTFDVVLQLPPPQTSSDHNMHILREVYSGGSLETDSIIMFYDKNFQNTSFSFSPKLDSIKKAKLFKIQIFNDTIRHPSYAFTLPRREHIFEMKDTVLTDDSKIRNLFNRYLNGK